MIALISSMLHQTKIKKAEFEYIPIRSIADHCSK